MSSVDKEVDKVRPQVSASIWDRQAAKSVLLRIMMKNHETAFFCFSRISICRAAFGVLVRTGRRIHQYCTATSTGRSVTARSSCRLYLDSRLLGVGKRGLLLGSRRLGRSASRGSTK